MKLITFDKKFVILLVNELQIEHVINKNSSSSLRWAIDELSKQKKELSSKLIIAKRDNTSSLIEEVNAQKIALTRESPH